MEQMRERNLGFERKSERQLLKLCDNMQTDSERLNQEHLTRITRLCWVVWPRGKLSKCTTQPSPNSQSSVSDTTQPSLNKSLTSFQLFLLLLFSLLPTNEIDAWKIWMCDWSKWRWFEFRMCVWGGRRGTAHCRQECSWPAIYYPVWGPGPILILGQIHKLLRKFRKSQSLVNIWRRERTNFFCSSPFWSHLNHPSQGKAGDSEKKTKMDAIWIIRV